MNIGEVAAATSLTERAIRYYERHGLVPPPARRESGYRTYEAADVARLRLIAAAREVGFTIERVRQLLDLASGASGEAERVVSSFEAELDVKGEALGRVRAALRMLGASGTEDEVAGRRDLGGEAPIRR